MTLLNTKNPLIVENHPLQYKGYEFITLLAYRDETYLTIINNSDKYNIGAYVLDFCQVENIDEEEVLNVASLWYEHYQHIPIAILFSLHNVDNVQKIYKTFNINYIKRVIGPLPEFAMGVIKKSKRKRKNVFSTT